MMATATVMTTNKITTKRTPVRTTTIFTSNKTTTTITPVTTTTTLTITAALQPPATRPAQIEQANFIKKN
jgi:hypothetical protein